MRVGEIAEVSKNVKRLTARQVAAVDCLLEKTSLTAAAECAGVSRQTLYNWLAIDEFKQAVDDAKRASVRQVTRRLAGALGASVDQVISLARSAEDEAVRLRAAVAIGTMLRDLDTHGEIDERLSDLEELVQQQIKSKRKTP